MDEAKNNEAAENEPAKAPASPALAEQKKAAETKPKKKRRVGRIIRKIIALILVFLLGFLSCIGAIAGAGYYAYKNVSLDKLEEMGLVQVDTSALIGDNADVSLTAMTIAGMIAEVQALSSLGDRVTLTFLIDRYQLKLPEEVQSYIPNGLRDVPLAQLASAEGIKAVLENTNVDYVLSLLPEGILSEPAQVQLADKTLQDVVDMNLGYLLQGVRLGYLTGVQYENADGEYRIVYADPENPTLMELFAPADLGKLLTALGEGKDLFVALCEDIGDVAVESLMETFIDLESFIFPGMFSVKTFADLVAINAETGAQYFDFGLLLNNRTIGEMLAYTPITNDSGSTVGWKDKDGNPVVGVMRGLAGADLSALGGDLSQLLSDLYLGDVFNYTPVLGEDGSVSAFVDGAGNTPASPYDTLSMYLVSDLTSGSLDFASLIGGETQVGVLMGYRFSEADNTWYDGNGNALSGIAASFVDLTVDELSDSDSITDRFGDVFVGDAIGLTMVDGYWTDNGERVTGIVKSLAGKKVGVLYDEMQSMSLGDIMGYTKNGDTWLDDKNHLVEGIALAFADLSIDRLNDTEALIEKLGDVCVGDAVNFDLIDGVWYDEGVAVSGIMKIIADKTIDELDEHTLDSIRIADALNYTKRGDKWYNGNTPVTGFMEVLAGKTIRELDEDIMNDLTIADAMNYEKRGDIWYDGNTPVTGIMKILADKSLNELGADTLDGITIAEILDYEKCGDDWYDGDKRVTGFMEVLADKTVSELNEDVLDGITFAELMNYERRNNQWYDGDKVVSGFMAELADKTLSELGADIFSGVTIAEAMNYTKKNGEWYDGNNKVSGFMAALADKKINELSEDVLGEITIAEAMNYTKKNGKWYDGNTAVTGVMRVLADKTIDELHDSVDSIRIGDIMNYTYYAAEDAWKNENGAKMTGIMIYFADLTMLDFTNPNTLLNRVQMVSLGEALGYEKRGDQWFDGNKEVSSFMQAIAGEMLGDIESVVNAMKIGQLLGYENHGDQWFDGARQLDALMNRICNATMDTLSSELNALTLADVVPASDRATGILSLVSGDTPLANLSTKLVDVLEVTTMSELVDGNAPIITIAPETAAKLDMVAPGWRNKNLTEFISYIVGLLGT